MPLVGRWRGDSLVNVLWSTVTMLTRAAVVSAVEMVAMFAMVAILAAVRRHSQSGIPNLTFPIRHSQSALSDRKGVWSEGCLIGRVFARKGVGARRAAVPSTVDGSTLDGGRSDGSAAEVYIPAGRSQSGTPSQPFWSEGCLIGRVQCDGAMVVVC